MLNVDPALETKEVLVRPTTKSPPPALEPSQETPVTPKTEVKQVAKEDDTISQEIETDQSTNKTDSSDEDETKLVYNIQMGKSLVVEPPRKLIEDDEVFENIKNENKEVIENTQQIEKVNGIKNENVSLVNKNLDHLRETTPSPRSESPLWSYTLPAPSTFADDRNSEISEVRSDHKIEKNDMANGDLSSETSDLSDVPIKPVIKQRIAVDFKALDETTNTESSMTSDIEDGYQGDKVRFSRGALLQSLESHRDDFIENEFGFLGKMDGDDDKKDIKSEVHITNGINKEIDHIASPKDEVINELNNVIVNNKLETVIRKSETSDDIESAQKSCLSNFTIQTYSNHVDVKIDSQVEGKISEVIESPVQLEKDFNKSILSDDITNKSDDEIVLRNPIEYTQSKRPSLSNGNLFKSPRVSRSDSFHSTRNGSTENLGLTSRSSSSSYISLIGTSKCENRSNKTTPRNSLTFTDSNRRKSSSELSIADSPSLQSLLVMKTILSNSRKNSLITDNVSNGVKESSEMDSENVSRKSSVELRPKSPIDVAFDDSSKENSPQNKLSSRNEKTESNTKWKYQGPPAINLSTWGERPKSMIAIKTDNDYKFGVLNNAAVKSTSTDPTPLMEAPEVPVNSTKSTVKPANVIVETPIESVDIPDHHLPIVRAVVKKIHPVSNASSDENHNIEIRRSNYEVSTIVTEKVKPEIRVPLQKRFSWKIPATFNNTSSTMNSNLNKNVPTVRGFKADTLESVADKDQSIDSGYKSLPPTVVLVNSNKEIIQERPKTQPPPTVTKRPSFVRQQQSEETNVVPFSQFTLRKTGLKEKIVGHDVDNSIKQPVIVSPPIQTIQLRQKQEVQTIQLNQKQEVPSIQSRQKVEVPTIQLRQKPEIQNVRPITFHATTTTTIPPPPPPIVKQVPIVRGVMTQKSLPIALDPRDALLDSIKNFNKNSLKKK